mmetsp:Transcript_7006/g.12988  ORF Transcript_7006/g.12988 Transcript_7006/m.12988 type:complete len:344 (+) Transcript_7006:749-1780(+)
MLEELWCRVGQRHAKNQQLRYRTSVNLLRQLKALWYLINTIANEESEDAQRNGVVLVVFSMGIKSQADRDSLWKVMFILRSLPTRVASIHYCYDDPGARSVADLALLALDPKSRARFRTHYGPHDDVVAELSTFGIGSNLLTVDPRSEESTMVIREWFATRRLKEASAKAAAAASRTTPTSGVVSDIGHYDVLFGKSKFLRTFVIVVLLSASVTLSVCLNHLFVVGRGKGVQAHPGNKRLRELVEANLERYERASRLEKTLLAETIVRNIKDTSGRFLKLDSGRGGGWTEVNDETARDKIAHAFRTQRKSLTQRQSPSDSVKMPAVERKPPPSGDGGGSFNAS